MLQVFMMLSFNQVRVDSQCRQHGNPSEQEDVAPDGHGVRGVFAVRLEKLQKLFAAQMRFRDVAGHHGAFDDDVLIRGYYSGYSTAYSWKHFSL